MPVGIAAATTVAMAGYEDMDGEKLIDVGNMFLENPSPEESENESEDPAAAGISTDEGTDEDEEDLPGLNGKMPTEVSNELLYRLLLRNFKQTSRNAKNIKRNRKRIDTNNSETSGRSIKDMVKKFRSYDKDGSGTIDMGEFKLILNDLRIEIGEKEYKLLWGQFDQDGDGGISIDEFTTRLQGHVKGMRPEELLKFKLDDLVSQMINQSLEDARQAILHAGRDSDEQDRAATLRSIGGRRIDTLNGIKTAKNLGIWGTGYPHSPYDQWPAPDAYFQRLRMSMHLTFEDESYSIMALVVFIVIMTMIVVSTICFVLETIPNIEEAAVWDYIEYVVSITFTVELTLRVVTCRNPMMFWRGTWYFWNTLNVIDFLAIVPFYINLGLKAAGSTSSESDFLRVIRIVRLARLVRLRRLGGMRFTMEVITRTFSKSWNDSGSVIGILIMFEILIASSFVYFCEKGSPVRDDFCVGASNFFTCTEIVAETNMALDGGVYLAEGTNICRWLDSVGHCRGAYFRTDGSPSPFDSIPKVMWWTVETMTTVGYGDLAPIEPWGQLLGILAQFSGVLVFALVTVVIATNFDEAQKCALKKKMFAKLARERADQLAKQALTYRKDEKQRSLKSRRGQSVGTLVGEDEDSGCCGGCLVWCHQCSTQDPTGEDSKRHVSDRHVTDEGESDPEPCSTDYTVSYHANRGDEGRNPETCTEEEKDSGMPSQSKPVNVGSRPTYGQPNQAMRSTAVPTTPGGPEDKSMATTWQQHSMQQRDSLMVPREPPNSRSASTSELDCELPSHDTNEPQPGGKLFPFPLDEKPGHVGTEPRKTPQSNLSSCPNSTYQGPVTLALLDPAKFPPVPPNAKHARDEPVESSNTQSSTLRFLQPSPLQAAPTPELGPRPPNEAPEHQQIGPPVQYISTDNGESQPATRPRSPTADLAPGEEPPPEPGTAPTVVFPKPQHRRRLTE